MKLISIFLPYLGCKERCMFCNQQILNDVFVVPGKIQIRKRIEAAIRTLPENEKSEIAFFGCSFSSMDMSMQEEYLQIAEAYSDHVQGVRISAYPGSFPDEEIKLLKKYNVTTIEIGIESLSIGVLKAAGRRYNSEDVLNDISKLKANGFTVVGQLMLGLPGDTKRKFMNAIKELIKTDLDFIRLHPTLILKNSDLEVMYFEKRYEPITLEESLDWMMGAFELLEESQIPLIRVGLFPSKSLTRSSNVIAGPFHPSLGELLKGRIFRKRIEEKLNGDIPENSFLEIFVNPREVSQASGYKKENVIYFIKKFRFMQVKVTQNEEIKPSQVEIRISK